MEAMTVMGMAASQARFLGLTARKSNVEYQGQQVNQERTALANDSANLFNQMMALEVPTPPNTNDFTKTTYVLEDSQDPSLSENYKIQDLQKTYALENEYNVTLSANKEITEAQSYVFTLIAKTKSEEVYDFTMSNGSKLTFDPSNSSAYDEDAKGYSIKSNTIYKVDNANLEGFSTFLAELGDKAPKNGDEYALYTDDESKECLYYFFQDKTGKNYFFTKEMFGQMKEFETTQEDSKKGLDLTFQSQYTYKKPVTTQAKAIVESSTSGRYSTITITDSDSDLNGRTFELSMVQETDQAAYDNAYNDYEYKKMQYEQEISNINGQTKIIQNEDQQLELRLKQLDTEQQAIATEIDSVTKVIDDNIDKTFKVFA